MQRHRPGNHPAARLDQPGTVRFRVPYSAPGISGYSTASPARHGRSVRSATISLARSMHGAQIHTPGPATSCTPLADLPQNEHP